ncbi:hypothetical protein QYF36_003919 [Acer negundo]|nr:hypothetical protein QYF36_003919 [Acer negundo]
MNRFGKQPLVADQFGVKKNHGMDMYPMVEPIPPRKEEIQVVYPLQQSRKQDNPFSNTYNPRKLAKTTTEYPTMEGEGKLTLAPTKAKEIMSIGPLTSIKSLKGRKAIGHEKEAISNAIGLSAGMYPRKEPAKRQRQLGYFMPLDFSRKPE